MIRRKNNLKNLKIKIVKYPSEKGIYEFHISRKCREKYDFNDDLFSLNGDVIFANFQNARNFTNKFIKKQKPEYLKKNKIRGSEITAIGLMDEIYHYIINLYKEEIDSKIISKAYKNIGKKINSSEINNTFKLFLNDFPNNSIYNKKATINDYLKKQTQGIPNSEIVLEEIILLWLSNNNPGYKPYKELFDDNKLKKDSEYQEIINELYSFLKNNPKFKESNNYLIETLNAPMLHSPNSIKGQLEFILNHWGKFLDKFLYRILSTLDYLSEEDKSGFVNFHSIDVLGFKDLENEPEKFSPDKEWMPNVVLIAKSIYVWLDQLSKKYSQNIYRLDQIPDEELDQLKKWGFNSLWLIGIWERSQASKKIKRKCGNPEAEASAYSLFDYNISLDIGGHDAFMNLKTRAEARGIKLASDMVPNHTGIDSKWIYENPDWFLSLLESPFPSYSFNGENLSGNGDIGIYLEDKYYDKTDAAVVFKYNNFRDGNTKFIYHGNDGTGMPWNDTAQLNYLNPEVREAVIQKILHVAGMFSVIRFDAAMTLTKKHYQRLWFPEPGTGGDIPSRAEHGISKKQFNKYIPKEFWREVVDRIAKEKPDTLLLAEAFWLMEGYFVRTLGMHRVYNSAFMNMLKSEENKNYRYTIKNVLEFNPEILKRFVNFMNNPDEETAAAQFGKQDKYFGVCILMSTMPGLPMFGHGQIEGFTEKYGMEFRKSYWNEDVDRDLVSRHEREVFPLLKKRYIFSEARNFLLYDYYTREGHINENVFAYSNSYGDEKALVVYNNKFDNTDGWIKTSVGFLDINNSNKVIQRSLGEGLNLHNDSSYYCIFKDFISGLFYIRSSKDIYENGIFVELAAFKYHVFMDIYEVQDNIWRHYSLLNAHLYGRGVNSIQQSLKEIIYKPVHNAFEELINPEMLKNILGKRSLNKNQKINNNMLNQVEKKLLKLISEIKKYLEVSAEQDELASEIMQNFNNLIKLPYIGNVFSIFDLNDQKGISDFFQNDLNINDFNNWIIMLIFIFVCKLGKLINKNKYQEYSIKFIDDWLLDKIIRNTLIDFNIEDFNVNKFLNLIKINIFYQNTFINNLSNKKGFDALFQKLIADSNIRLFLNVNLYNEAVWFNKENFELLVNFIFVYNFIELINTDKEVDKKNKNAVVTMLKTIQKWKHNAKKSNYQLDKMLKIISD